MSIETDRNTLTRLQKEIATLRKQDAAEAKKEVDANSKAAKAAQAAAKANSSSSMQTKLREAERYQNTAASSSKKRAEIAQKVAQKIEASNRLTDRITKAEATQRKKDQDRLTILTRDLERQERATKRALSKLASQSAPSARVIPENAEYDVFISHASEDKDSFVREFAEVLRERGLKVWYDEHSLKWGDSLWQEINKGLANSRYGVVVLSVHFFAKKWPQTELDGLMAKEIEGTGRVLPIWHNISKDQVLSVSPVLGNKLALNTSVLTLGEIADQLCEFCTKE